MKKFSQVEAFLNSTDYKFLFRLDTKDISGITFSREFEFPLVKIHLVIGGEYLATFSSRIELENFPIYLSLCCYHKSYLVFEFDKEYLKSDEEVEIETLGDLCVFYSECDDNYHRGRQVITKKKQKPVSVFIPEMTFHFFPENTENVEEVVSIGDTEIHYKGGTAWVV